MIILDTGNILLREINLADTQNIIKWRNRADVKKFFFKREEITVLTHEKWFNASVLTGSAKQFIIVDKTTNNEIGSAFLKDICYENYKAEFGFFIGSDKLRSKGVGTATCKLLVKYAFDELKLNRVYMRMNSANIGSYKVALKAGFIEEGLLRKDAYYEGEFIDTHMMGILREDYLKITDYI